MVGLATHSRFHFGSVSNGLKYLQGHVFDIQPEVFLFTTSSTSDTTATFEIENLSEHAAKLIGSKTSCGCVVVNGLPLTFSAREKKRLQIAVNLKDVVEDGRFSQSVTFYTDAVRQPMIAAQIEGTVSSPPKKVTMRSGEVPPSNRGAIY